jgi:UPF0755 protein
MNEHLKDILLNIKKEFFEIVDFIKENVLISIVGLIIILGVIFYYLISSPLPKNAEILIDIEEGTSVKAAATMLKEKEIIRSRTIFSLIVQFSENKTIGAGTYMFDEPENSFKVARRLKNLDFGIPVKSVTLSEGMTVEQMATRLESNFNYFDTENFIKLATKYEGYLFPDTYRFSALIDEVEIIEALRNNFNDKILPLKEEIENSGKTLDEIITMASIVEKEADRNSIQEVTDILWHRMEIDMALQVDATFVYSIDKHSFTVTRAEMQDDSNPYNTYTHKGLPPTPISNPGLEAISASINPNPTEYLYFLTGRDGNMYYAADFDGHRENRRLYLD